MMAAGATTRRARRSDTIKLGFERVPHRALLRATDVIKDERDFKKPFVAVMRIDIGARRIDVELTDEAIAARIAEATPPARELLGHRLRRYHALVTSADIGAVLRGPDE